MVLIFGKQYKGNKQHFFLLPLCKWLHLKLQV